MPNLPLAIAAIDWAVRVGAGAPTWRPQAPSQTVSLSVNRHGETVYVVHNWAWDPSEFALPDAAEDVLWVEAFAATMVESLGAWDVRLFVVR